MVDRSRWGTIRWTNIHNSLLHTLEVIALCNTWSLSRAEHKHYWWYQLAVIEQPYILEYLSVLSIFLISESIERGRSHEIWTPPSPKITSAIGFFRNKYEDLHTPSLTHSALGLPNPSSLEILVPLELSIGTLCKSKKKSTKTSVRLWPPSSSLIR